MDDLLTMTGEGKAVVFLKTVKEPANYKFMKI